MLWGQGAFHYCEVLISLWVRPSRLGIFAIPEFQEVSLTPLFFASFELTDNHLSYYDAQRPGFLIQTVDSM